MAKEAIFAGDQCNRCAKYFLPCEDVEYLFVRTFKDISIWLHPLDITQMDITGNGKHVRIVSIGFMRECTGSGKKQ